MITVVNYGLGNIHAFVNMYKRMNIEVRVATSAADLEDATRVILPGVGAFDHAMELLDASGIRPKLDQLVRERRVPLLGVCVGMQILADGSDEGKLPGLGWIPGRVRAFGSEPRCEGLPLPHMGWNDVRPVPGSSLFQRFDREPRFYFLHSYFFQCAAAEDVAATASYGIDFGCAVFRGNVHGVQFHPEKSHHWGAAVLKTFAEL